MARPELKWITFEIDGREVRAPEGALLVDAAKHGDVEIPYFCYEPKLGQPVGACRMCLVEIEGIPKLQTSCSTPVRDGMVVNTTSDRVKHAQNAIVEFLLVNHPLDCPVCDKGGECPLQDISYGWGAGRSRYIEPKRHFKKPLELSPLVAIDRERCILCYRCVRFSQEIAEDYQLVFLERGDHTFVGTNDGRPYVAPFSGNIIELCPVGALTSTAYRFRARPWDIEDSGTVCTLCPAQCNVTLTLRDDVKVVRVLARDNEEVDDGWLCDKGRFGYQAFAAEERITAPMVRDGGYLREVSWERALSEAGGGAQQVGREHRRPRRWRHHQRGGLPRPASAARRPRLSPPDQRPRHRGRGWPASSPGPISAPGSPTSTTPAPSWWWTPSRWTRRPSSTCASARRRGATAPRCSRSRAARPPSTPTPPRRCASRRAAPRPCWRRWPPPWARRARRARRWTSWPGGRAPPPASSPAVPLRRRPPRTATARARPAASRRRRCAPWPPSCATRATWWSCGASACSPASAARRPPRRCWLWPGALGIADKPESGLIAIPADANGRGLREVGCSPHLGPGLTDAPESGDPAGAEGGALLLVGTELPEAALEQAAAVIAFSSFPSEALEREADVIFPAETYAEKEGTVTHPDGRVQRVRQALGHAGEVRPGWQVLADLCERLEAGTGVLTAPMVTALMNEAVPFYAGLTLEEVGGLGVRWQDRDAASALPEARPSDEALADPPAAAEGLRLAGAPTLWTGGGVTHSPSLRFLDTGPTAELSVEDARRIGVSSGDQVELSAGGESVLAVAAVRTGVPAGSVFLSPPGLADGPVEIAPARSPAEVG